MVFLPLSLYKRTFLILFALLPALICNLDHKPDCRFPGTLNNIMARRLWGNFLFSFFPFSLFFFFSLYFKIVLENYSYSVEKAETKVFLILIFDYYAWLFSHVGFPFILSGPFSDTERPKSRPDPNLTPVSGRNFCHLLALNPTRDLPVQRGIQVLGRIPGLRLWLRTASRRRHSNLQDWF